MGGTVEAERAKHGASWVRSFRDRAVGLEDAKGDLARGRTQIVMDVDNLPLTLPCDFRLQRLGADYLELLSAGTPLAEIDDIGTIGVRSDWVSLTQDFQVNRPLNQHMSIQWAWFRFERRASREGFSPSNIWVPSSDAVISAKVRAQLEVTEKLTPFLHLCQGDPHYLLASEPTIDLGRHFGRQYWLESENRLTAIPAAIWVSSQADKEGPEGVEMELFPSWLPDPGDAVTTFFRDLFRDSDNPQLAPRPGRVSSQLPYPDETGEYRFFVRWPDGREGLIHVERVRGQLGPTARFVATLDARGWLTIHRGYPPYWKAESIAAVQKRAGSVFRVEMEHRVSDVKDS